MTKPGLTFAIIYLFLSSISGLILPISPANAQSNQRDLANQSAIYVEPISLGEVADGIGLAINIGAVVSDQEVARGIQKAADVYGINLNLFIIPKPADQYDVVRQLLVSGDAFIIADATIRKHDSPLSALPVPKNSQILILGETKATAINDRFKQGFAALQEARAALVDKIPKYDQILPNAFPVTPLPDNFFQPSKYPYPNPLVRAARTRESLSATVHAHTSCNMVAQTGNMLHRTSSNQPNRLLMGMEGGNLSLEALPGALDKAKLSAVMTSWVLDVNDSGASRQVLVENNGIESSQFGIGIHAPEELAIILEQWLARHEIKAFSLLGPDKLAITDQQGVVRQYRAGMFLVANDHGAKEPQLIFGEDAFGAKTIDFYSTQSFVQQFAEILKPAANRAEKIQSPNGGILTMGGTSVGNHFGRPLSAMIQTVGRGRVLPVQPFVMAIEGGFIVVTPERPITPAQLASAVKRIYMDLRGPLTSDQSIFVYLANGEKLLFRRTVLSFSDLDEAFNTLRTMGMIEKWDYEGVRGRGLYANVVLHNFLGKHRKFMSSLATWPTKDRPAVPAVRFYVDGMQRLNFAFVTKDGWRQEFVEVPLRIPPVPRDVALFSGKSDLKPEQE